MDLNTYKMLTFNYGLMSSGKSTHLIGTYHTVKDYFNIVILKPKIDTRSEPITTRGNDSLMPTHIVDVEDAIHNLITGADFVFVDEVQFFSVPQIIELRKAADRNIHVVTYGLLSRWDGTPFTASAHLMCLADIRTEIGTETAFCRNCRERKAVINHRLVKSNDEIVIGNDYVSLCFTCFDV